MHWNYSNILTKLKCWIEWRAYSSLKKFKDKWKGAINDILSSNIWILTILETKGCVKYCWKGFKSLDFMISFLSNMAILAAKAPRPLQKKFLVFSIIHTQLNRAANFFSLAHVAAVYWVWCTWNAHSSLPVWTTVWRLYFHKHCHH